jgi:hypothetical protein
MGAKQSASVNLTGVCASALLIVRPSIHQARCGSLQ